MFYRSTMEQKQKQHLLSLHLFFLENLEPNSIVDEMYAKKYINLYDYEILISKQKTRWEKVREILCLIPRLGPHSYNNFCEIVKSTQLPFISQKLDEKKI